MKQTLLLAILLFGAANLNASTKLKVSWKNPNYSPRPLKTILALGMSNNLENRADFEVALASKMARPGITTIAGTDILLRPTAGPINMTYLKEQIAAYKIDAVVVCRLVKVKTDTVDVPGQPYFLPYYNSFYGYYGAVYPIVYSPDYLVQEKTVQIETNVYAINSSDDATHLDRNQRHLRPQFGAPGDQRIGRAGREGVGEAGDPSQVRQVTNQPL